MEALADRKEVFRRVYLAYYPKIVAYARRRLAPEEADDLVADTFLVAWRRLEEIPDGDMTLPWLYGVARRTLSQSARSKRRRERLHTRISSWRSVEEEDTREIDSVEDRQLVRVALSSLRPEDQEVLRLAEWEQLRHAEIAVVLGCSSNAVAIRLHRAHRRFAQALAAVEDTPTRRHWGATR
jgi:RNA polymerase sigma-70 factor, ECF subfamily